MRAGFAIAVAALIAGSLGTETPRAQTVDFSALEEAANSEMTRHRVPGMALAIVKDDRVVFMKGFGVANVETGEPVRPGTLFRIASLTKMLTAAALVTQSVKEREKLDEPIGAYSSGLTPRLSRLTARQLLSHTAGVAH